MNEGINLVLVLILLAIGCFGFCIRKSPKAMLALAAYLLATVEADEKRAKSYESQHAAWRRELGIEQ